MGSRESVGVERSLGYRPALDGLRGVALLAVLVHHSGVVLPGGEAPIPGGFLGVDLFFALSGFLITVLLREERARTGGVALGGFYRRRALRLVPALGALLIVFLAYAHLSSQVDVHRAHRTVFAALTYHLNWLAALRLWEVAPPLGHLWTLSVEGQFYLIWPLVVALLARLRRVPGGSVLPIAVLVGAALVVAVHRAQLAADGMNWISLLVRTDTRADVLLLGAAAGWLWSDGTRLRGLGVTGLAAAAFLAFAIVRWSAQDPALHQGGFTLVGAAAAIVVLAAAEAPSRVRRLLEARPLVALGRVSYGVYLWHLPLLILLPHHLGRRGLPALLSAAALTALIAGLSWMWIERPLLRRKRVRPLLADDPTPPPAPA